MSAASPVDCTVVLASAESLSRQRVGNFFQVFYVAMQIFGRICWQRPLIPGSFLQHAQSNQKVSSYEAIFTPKPQPVRLRCNTCTPRFQHLSSCPSIIPFMLTPTLHASWFTLTLIQMLYSFPTTTPTAATTAGRSKCKQTSSSPRHRRPPRLFRR